MNEITAFDINQLAKRWGCSPASIRRMEREGKLHRLPDLPGVRYSAAEVYQLESLGRDAQAMTAWERRKMQEENRELRQTVQDLQERLTKVMAIAQGVSL